MRRDVQVRLCRRVRPLQDRLDIFLHTCARERSRRHIRLICSSIAEAVSGILSRMAKTGQDQPLRLEEIMQCSVLETEGKFKLRRKDPSACWKGCDNARTYARPRRGEGDGGGKPGNRMQVDLPRVWVTDMVM